MPKMIALKKFRYPSSGPNRKEHMPGDEVDVLTDRDAKALRSIKMAKDTETPAASEPEPKAKPPTKAEDTGEPAPVTNASMAAEEPRTTRPRTSRSRYNREDMTSEE